MQLQTHSCLIVVVLILLGVLLSRPTGGTFANNAVANSQTATKWVSKEELVKMTKKRVEPAYPPAATAILIHALIPKVEVKVNKEGNVISARAVSGASLLRDAALEAARSWKFAPIQDKDFSEVVGPINFGFPAEIPIKIKGGTRGIDYYEEEVRKAPQSWLAHCRLATAYLAHNQVAQAISEYQQALALSPESAVVYYGLGDCYRQIRQYQKALEFFQNAARSEPGFVEAYEAIGATQEVLGGMENSIRYSFELSDGNIVTKEERKDHPKIDGERLSHALLAYQRAMETRQDLDIRMYNLKSMAEVHYVAGKLDEVAKLYEEIVKLDYELFAHGQDDMRSGPAQHLNTLASLYKKLGRDQEAISAYQRIVDFEPISDESVDASLEMASLYKKLGNRTEAMAICQKWLDWVDKEEKRSKELRANYLRGRVYNEMERYQDAIVAFKKAAAKKTSDSIAENEWLYELYLKVGDQKAAAEQKVIIDKFYEEWERPFRTGKIIKLN